MTAANPVAPAITNPYDFDDLGVVEDPLTGRLSVGGREIGDTGWRNVSSLLENGWTGTIRIRRHGYVVEMQIAPIVATSATSDTFLTQTLLGGTGFRPKDGVGWQSIVSNTSAYFRQVSGLLEVVNRATGTYYGTFVWTTTDSWPTSLPGVAA